MRPTLTLTLTSTHRTLTFTLTLTLALTPTLTLTRYARFTGSELRAGGGAAVRAVKEFVRSIVDENTEATLLPLEL